MSDIRRPRYVLTLIWNITLAVLAYVCSSAFVHTWSRPPLFLASRKLQALDLGNRSVPAVIEYTVPEVVGDEKRIRIKFTSIPTPVKMDRSANAFNRPQSLVELHDDYLGNRPHVDTEIDFEALMNGCRGDLERSHLYKNTSHCLDFLTNHEDQYTILPPEGSRASDRDPRLAEYLNADGHGNTKVSYLPVEHEEQPPNSSRGTCSGPIIPYHVYWRGPATWRVEVFVKAYLHTQNLACSRLNLWLDSDPFPNAVNDMLHNDPLFEQFLPLVERGYLSVRSWRFPSRILVPRARNPSQRRRSNDSAVRLDEEVKGSSFFDLSGRRNPATDRILLSQKQKTFLPVAVSDAVRFIVLHLYGGGYFDMDVLLLRDMRPFYLPRNHSFAERWSTYTNGGFNTAIMSLAANSSLSTYFLRGAMSMGFNFHPLILGIMAQKDGRNQELQTMEHGLFDPLWARYAGDEQGPCPVPCFHGDYSKAFKGGPKPLKGEWRSYTGPQLKHIPLGRPAPNKWKTGRLHKGQGKYIPHRKDRRRKRNQITNLSREEPEDHHSFNRRSPDLQGHDPVDIEFLIDADIVTQYDRRRDKWPPNNRTMENFFRGAYTYHIHNQWDSRPEPNSWLNVIEHAHDRFFAGEAPNPYGEMWTGPFVPAYRTWAEFL